MASTALLLGGGVCVCFVCVVIVACGLFLWFKNKDDEEGDDDNKIKDAKLITGKDDKGDIAVCQGYKDGNLTVPGFVRNGVCHVPWGDVGEGLKDYTLFKPERAVTWVKERPADPNLVVAGREKQAKIHLCRAKKFEGNSPLYPGRVTPELKCVINHSNGLVEWSPGQYEYARYS